MNSELIGKFIQEERKKLNITQEELANMIHVSNKAVSKWENGKGMPSIDYIVLLAKTFNVSVTEILEGKRNNDNIKSHEEVIVKSLKTNKKLFIVNVVLSILLGLSLCFLEALLYLAKVDAIYGYAIFFLFVISGFILEYKKTNNHGIKTMVLNLFFISFKFY